MRPTRLFLMGMMTVFSLSALRTEADTSRSLFGLGIPILPPFITLPVTHFVDKVQVIGIKIATAVMIIAIIAKLYKRNNPKKESDKKRQEAPQDDYNSILQAYAGMSGMHYPHVGDIPPPYNTGLNPYAQPQYHVVDRFSANGQGYQGAGDMNMGMPGHDHNAHVGYDTRGHQAGNYMAQQNVRSPVPQQYYHSNQQYSSEGVPSELSSQVRHQMQYQAPQHYNQKYQSEDNEELRYQPNPPMSYQLRQQNAPYQTGQQNAPVQYQKAKQNTPQRHQTGQQNAPVQYQKSKQNAPHYNSGQQSPSIRHQPGKQNAPVRYQSAQQKPPQYHSGQQNNPPQYQLGQQNIPQQYQSGQQNTPQQYQWGQQNILQQYQGQQNTPQQYQSGQQNTQQYQSGQQITPQQYQLTQENNQHSQLQHGQIQYLSGLQSPPVKHRMTPQEYGQKYQQQHEAVGRQRPSAQQYSSPQQPYRQEVQGNYDMPNYQHPEQKQPQTRPASHHDSRRPQHQRPFKKKYQDFQQREPVQGYYPAENLQQRSPPVEQASRYESPQTYQQPNSQQLRQPIGYSNTEWSPQPHQQGQQTRGSTSQKEAPIVAEQRPENQPHRERYPMASPVQEPHDQSSTNHRPYNTQDRGRPNQNRLPDIEHTHISEQEPENQYNSPLQSEPLVYPDDHTRYSTSLDNQQVNQGHQQESIPEGLQVIPDSRPALQDNHLSLELDDYNSNPGMTGEVKAHHNSDQMKLPQGHLDMDDSSVLVRTRTKRSTEWDKDSMLEESFGAVKALDDHFCLFKVFCEVGNDWQQFGENGKDIAMLFGDLENLEWKDGLHPNMAEFYASFLKGRINGHDLCLQDYSACTIDSAEILDFMNIVKFT